MNSSRSACSRSRSVSGRAWRAALVDLEHRTGDELGGPLAADLERDDLVVVPVDHQGRDVDLGQVGSEVGGRERRDALVRGAVPTRHPLQPERVAEALVDVLVAVVPEERPVREVAVELGPVRGLAGPDPVEHVERQPLGVVVGLQHERWHGRHEHEPGDPCGAVPPHVVDDLAATRGVPDQGEVVQVERLDEGGQVVGVGVHLVAVPGLGGATVAAAVVGDDPVTVLGQEPRRGIPGIGVQRPAVAEDHGRPAAPVLVEDLCAVVGGDEWHDAPFGWLVSRVFGVDPTAADHVPHVVTTTPDAGPGSVGRT